MGARVEEDSGIDGARLRALAKGLLDGAPATRWWPYEGPLEIALSAILTQRTKWDNAVRAMDNLRKANLLDATALNRAERSMVEECVRPAGFYRQKARAVQEVGSVLVSRFGASTDRLFHLSYDELRRELLTWRGVGPETADAIMLYAGGRAAFVVDAYTQRLQRRFGAVVMNGDPTYAQTAAAWARASGGRVETFKALHGAIVDHCKTVCTAVPDCPRCALSSRCAKRL